MAINPKPINRLATLEDDEIVILTGAMAWAGPSLKELNPSMVSTIEEVFSLLVDEMKERGMEDALEGISEN